MCVPCGPRHESSGRQAFITEDGVKRNASLDDAKKKYSDEYEAFHAICNFISDNIDHTYKWILNELFEKDRLLARIAVEEQTNFRIKKFYHRLKYRYEQSKKSGMIYPEVHDEWFFSFPIEQFPTKAQIRSLRGGIEVLHDPLT